MRKAGEILHETAEQDLEIHMPKFQPFQTTPVSVYIMLRKKAFVRHCEVALKCVWIILMDARLCFT